MTTDALLGTPELFEWIWTELLDHPKSIDRQRTKNIASYLWPSFSANRCAFLFSVLLPQWTKDRPCFTFELAPGPACKPIFERRLTKTRKQIFRLGAAQLGVGRRLRQWLAAAMLPLLPVAAVAETTPVVSLFGTAKHGPDFPHFDYVNPDAPRRGDLRQGSRVSFDTTNGMRFPGKMPNELNYIYDTLMVRAEDEPASFYGLLAKAVEVGADFKTPRFELWPEARWHQAYQDQNS